METGVKYLILNFGTINETLRDIESFGHRMPFQISSFRLSLCFYKSFKWCFEHHCLCCSFYKPYKICFRAAS